MGSKAPSKTTSTTEPWSGAKPYYGDLYSAAQNAFNSTDHTGYQGQLYAGPNSTQQQALDMFKQNATTADTGGMQLRQLGLDTLSGKYMDPTTNPYLTGAINAAIDPVQQRLMRQVIPGIQDQSIINGAYGGAGNGVAQGVAAGDFGKAALDATSQLTYNNYQAERDRQLNSGQLFNQANQLLQLPAMLLDQAGTQQQNWEQAALDAALKKYQMDQAAPWAGLGEFAQILNGGGFSTTTGTTPGASRAASALQGAAGAAGAFSSLFPTQGGNGVNDTGTAIAAALAALASGWG